MSISGEASKLTRGATLPSTPSRGTRDYQMLKALTVKIKEVDAAREAYAKAGVTGDIYLMAVGATQEGQAKTSSQVAEMAMKSGYKYTPRLHVDLFGNQWGT